MRDSGLQESTIGVRRCTLRRLAEFLGHPISTATEAELLKWRSSLQISPDAIRVSVSHVKSFFVWAADYGVRRTNPARRIPVPQRTHRVPRPIAEEDLIVAIAEAPRVERLILVLMGALGLRACEIAGMRWESIHVAEGYLIVSRESTKGKRRERTLALTAEIICELERYGLEKRGWVILRRDGKGGPNQSYVISGRVNRYLRSIGQKATGHMGRHRVGTQLLRACNNPRIVQEVLGHASLSTVAIYTEIDLRDQKSAMSMMPAIT